MELLVEGGVKVGAIEAPGMFAHRDTGGLGEGDPVRS